MKKRISSVILAMFLIFTLSSCSFGKAAHENQAKIPETPTAEIIEKDETKPSTTLTVEETEAINPYHIEDCLVFVDLETVEAMTFEEVNALSENLVHMSKTAYLSPWDMYEMGTMFNFIWDYPEYDKAKFEKEFCEAFDNVCQHATEIGSTFDILEPWIDTPVVEVMCKYLSSSNFEKPVELWSRVINELSEEDLALVTDSFVNNPTMAVNAEIARSIICATENKETANKAWEHLLNLSSSDVVGHLDPFYTGYICFDIFTNQDLVYDEKIILERIYNNEHIIQIARNILNNPSFDFIEKYSYFCDDFFVGSDVDVEIFQNVVLGCLSETLDTYPKGERRDLAQALHKASYKQFDKLPDSLQREYNLILLNCLVEVY